jgi:TolB-like protein/DNA-binding winged helix-turn-helix (wHTH) protein
MERQPTTPLRIGEWCVNPASGQISRNGTNARVEVRTMRLLLCLAERAGQIVSIDELLNQVWPDVAVAPDSVYQAVASLRRLLGDDSKQPAYIETIPRLGYRLVAAVGTCPDRAIESQPEEQADFASPTPSEHPLPGRWHGRKLGLAGASGAALCLALGLTAWAFLHTHAGHGNSTAAPVPQPQKSIAVLPFLDLTEGMKNEEFADGMTEELIDKLSKIPGLRVSSPTSSFFYKGKQFPVADIAKSLGVVYVLDGSVRKSAGRVRVAARLVRADTGFVIWTESYDRPFTDLIMVQDDIGSEVTKTLSSATEFNTR